MTPSTRSWAGVPAETEGGKLAMGATSGALAELATGGESQPAVVGTWYARRCRWSRTMASELAVAWLGLAATAFLELAGRSAVGAAKVGAPGVAAVKQAVTATGQLGERCWARARERRQHRRGVAGRVQYGRGECRGQRAGGYGVITANAAEPWQVGQQVRDDLTARQTALTAARSSAADDAYAAFRQQPPIAADKLFHSCRR